MISKKQKHRSQNYFQRKWQRMFIWLIIITLKSYSQNLSGIPNIDKWQKAVVNIETEGFKYPQFVRDAILQQAKDSGYTIGKLDSLKTSLNTATEINTGTALYVIDREKKYLVTAKHVLFDKVFFQQKMFEASNKGLRVDTLSDVIFTRISIRTPLFFFKKSNQLNTLGVINDNLQVVKSFIFLSDSTGDGLAIISLQDKYFKYLDTVLQLDGYKPIPITMIDSGENLKPLEDVIAIGFPEIVSVVLRENYLSKVTVTQLPDIVASFITSGKVAMIDSGFHFYYVDLTIAPGNSGSPVIHNNKLVGIVSGINKYSIITDDYSKILQEHIFGVGHLVAIIKVNNLINGIRKLQQWEKMQGFNK